MRNFRKKSNGKFFTKNFIRKSATVIGQHGIMRKIDTESMVYEE